MLAPFWLRFGRVLDPFWHPSRAKFRPRCLFKLYLLQNRDFHENFLKPMKFYYFSAQDGSENDLKMTQNQSKTVPKAIIFHLDFLLQFWIALGSVLAPFWDPFGLPNRPQIRPKWPTRQSPINPLQALFACRAPSINFASFWMIFVHF